jgi:23S rRNA (cytidine1920-2'-O)/16S rRNA (cytidine1409-2'-O)-methyltransferase
VVDLSFRSIVGAGKHILGLVREGWLITLVKPQFEWRTPSEGFSGVVTQSEDRMKILFQLLERLWHEGSYVSRVGASAIEGRKGNREFFFLIKSRSELELEAVKSRIEKLVS